MKKKIYNNEIRIKKWKQKKTIETFIWLTIDIFILFETISVMKDHHSPIFVKLGMLLLTVTLLFYIIDGNKRRNRDIKKITTNFNNYVIEEKNKYQELLEKTNNRITLHEELFYYTGTKKTNHQFYIMNEERKLLLKVIDGYILSPYDEIIGKIKISLFHGKINYNNNFNISVKRKNANGYGVYKILKSNNICNLEKNKIYNKKGNIISSKEKITNNENGNEYIINSNKNEYIIINTLIFITCEKYDDFLFEIR